MYFLTTQVNSTAADEDEWETPNSLDALEPLLTEEGGVLRRLRGIGAGPAQAVGSGLPDHLIT